MWSSVSFLFCFSRTSLHSLLRKHILIVFLWLLVTHSDSFRNLYSPIFLWFDGNFYSIDSNVKTFFFSLHSHQLLLFFTIKCNFSDLCCDWIKTIPLEFHTYIKKKEKCIWPMCLNEQVFRDEIKVKSREKRSFHLIALQWIVLNNISEFYSFLF